MDKLDKLFEIADRENIFIYYVQDIPGYNAEALYVARNNIRMILILESLKDNLLHLTEVLAEEIGHYFTSTGHNYEINNYSDKLKIDRCENKAMKWACNFLVPKNELIDGIRKAPSGLSDLADILEVSKEMLMQSLYYLSLNNDMLHIEGDYYLILINYPAVYIYKKLK